MISNLTLGSDEAGLFPVVFGSGRTLISEVLYLLLHF